MEHRRITTVYRVTRIEPWETSTGTRRKAETWLCEKHYQMLAAFLSTAGSR